MKVYGNGMKATEFNKRDLAPIYRMAKEGTLKVEKWFMNDLYNMAEYYNFDNNGNAERYERKVLDLLKIEDIAELQDAINEMTESEYSLLGIKAQQKANRNMVA